MDTDQLSNAKSESLTPHFTAYYVPGNLITSDYQFSAIVKPLLYFMLQNNNSTQSGDTSTAPDDSDSQEIFPRRRTISLIGINRLETRPEKDETMRVHHLKYYPL